MVNRFYKTGGAIAHYTKLKTGIEILKSKQLWLMPRREQLDPFEYLLGSKDNMTRHSGIRDNDEFMHSSDVDVAAKQVASFYKRIRQASFCSTIVPEWYKRFSYDYYCFMHLRMWEQYGDSYQGCCLVFDKERLEKNNPHVTFKKVEYKSIEQLGRILLQMHLDVDQLKEEQQGYISKEEEIAIRRSLIKASDYKDEEEYRALVISKDDSVEHECLDLNGAIRGLAYFPKYSIVQCKEDVRDLLIENQKALIALAKDMTIDVFRLLVSDSFGIGFELLKDYEEYCDGIRRRFV